MTIYIYSVPAMLALILKAVILYLSQRAEVQNSQTRLFSATVLASLGMSVAELVVLQRFGQNAAYYGALYYYVAHILMFALLAHLAILISFDNLNKHLHLLLSIVLYGYAVALEILLLFSSQLISGFQPLQGYTVTRIPGPLLWVYEVFVAICMLTTLIVPIWGLRKERSPIARSRCKLWLISVFPFGSLVIAIISLLHFQIYLFNASVTTPLLITLLLAATGYATHNRRIVDLNFYVPWSKARKLKKAFYARITALSHEVPQFRSIDGLIRGLADIVKCPVALLGSRNAGFLSGEDAARMSTFPVTDLIRIDQMRVANEIRGKFPREHKLMAEYKVAVIVPFFPHSTKASCWLLLGELFSQRIYTPQDFRAIESLFQKIAVLFLDEIINKDFGGKDPGAYGRDNETIPGTSDFERPEHAVSRKLKYSPQKSFKEVVSEFETQVIRDALQRCRGNQAEAARMLGLRPNTLYYKIERYRLGNEKQKS